MIFFLLAIFFLYAIFIYGGIACIMIYDWIVDIIDELRKKSSSK